MSVTAVPLQPTNNSTRLWLWLGLVLAVLLAFGLAWTGTRAQVAAKGTNEQFLAWNKGQPGVTTTATGVQIQELKAGDGPAIADGDGVILPITGKFRDGTVFQPAMTDQWLVNPQDRIPGYYEAVKLMRKGGKYRVFIPPAQGYGVAPQNPQMRKDAVLIFDMEVQEHLTAADIQKMREEQMRQQQMMMGGAPGAEDAEGEPKAGEPKAEAAPSKKK